MCVRIHSEIHTSIINHKNEINVLMCMCKDWIMAPTLLQQGEQMIHLQYENNNTGKHGSILDAFSLSVWITSLCLAITEAQYQYIQCPFAEYANHMSRQWCCAGRMSLDTRLQHHRTLTAVVWRGPGSSRCINAFANPKPARNYINYRDVIVLCHWRRINSQSYWNIRGSCSHSQIY